MTCGKIKELILTDYIDNEMNDEEKVRLNMHLVHCHGCKEFLEAVNNAAVGPFAGAKQIQPPGFIWQRVREAVTAERQEKISFPAGLLEKLKTVFYFPKPVLIVSTIAALALIIVLAVTLKFGSKAALDIGRGDQVEYSAYSIETPVSALLNNDGGFGTSVEKYFL
jgi:predicted anti-sigma-YlaC factor YlaD